MMYNKYPGMMPLSSYVKDPNDTLYENEQRWAKARLAQQNGLTRGLDLAGMFAEQIGRSLIDYGIGGLNESLSKGRQGIVDGLGVLNSIAGVYGQGMYAYGGDMMSGEAEGGEVVDVPGEGIYRIHGPSHEDGGVPLSFDSKSTIFSKRIKIGGKSIAQRVADRGKTNGKITQQVKARPYDRLAQNSFRRYSRNDEYLKQQERKLQEEYQRLMNQ